jgi:hypothetical protein
MGTNGNSNGPPSLATLQTGAKQKRKYTRRVKPEVGGFKIEKGIPIPPEQPKFKYPWDLMEVGDSFFVQKPANSFAGGVAARSKKGPKQYTYRRENGGLRVWRTK